MQKTESARKRERRAFAYLLGICFSYITMLGGFGIFILLVVGVSPYLMGGVFSAYLTFALAVLMTFLHVPIKRFRLRKYFAGSAFFFLLMAAVLLVHWVLGS
ncbi:MAG: hypothetical protein U9M97_03180 [Candidatus Hadarchaeota archaeon]|nr:hypothetical protein [Candidatus Hadarchaeota archaeon]